MRFSLNQNDLFKELQEKNILLDENSRIVCGKSFKQERI
jgi:hypothetical protein